MKKVGIYQQKWNTSYDSQHLLGLIAQILSERNEVEFISHDSSLNQERMGKAMGADLSRTSVRLVDSPDWTQNNSSFSLKSAREFCQEISAPYEVFLNASNDLPIFCNAKNGILLTEFPGCDFDVFFEHNSLEWKNTGFIKRFFRKRKEALIWSCRLSSYQKHWCFSDFTRQWCGKKWQISPKILPLVRGFDLEKMEKKPLIVVLGKFSEENLDRHDLLINAFQDFVDKMISRLGLSPDWKMLILGECDGAEKNLEFVERLREKAYGYPIEIIVNPDQEKVRVSLAEALFLWNAKGYETNEFQPECQEHIGIKILKAQNAGVIPIVFHAGCVSEVIRHGMNGFLWSKYREMIDFTSAIMVEERILPILGQGAFENAKKYDENMLRKTLSEEVKNVLEVTSRESE